MSAFEGPRRLKYAGGSANDPLAAALTDVQHDEPSQAELRELEHRVQLALAMPVGALAVKGALGAKGALGVKGALLAKLTSSLIAVPLAVGALAGVTIASISSHYLARAVVHLTPSPTPVPPAYRQPSAPPPRPGPLLSAARALESVKEPPGHAGPQRAPAPAASAEPQPAAPGVEAAETEVSLLARAQAALANSPQAALDLVTSHALRFGAGSLAQEREMIAISALLRLGRRGEADTRARAFRSAFPTSAYTRRIDVLMQGRDPK